MDFESYAYYREKGVRYYWGFGTAVSCVSLAAGLIHIVIEYCTQSHLSTEDYESAARGLRMTRWFKKFTDSRLPGRYLARYMHKITRGFTKKTWFKNGTAWLRTLGRSTVEYMHKMTFGIFESHSKSLVWDWMTKDERIRMSRSPVIDGQIPPTAGEAQACTPLADKMQEELSPITGTGCDGPKNRQCADAASAQKEREAGFQMRRTRKPVPECLVKVEDSGEGSSVEKGS